MTTDLSQYLKLFETESKDNIQELNADLVKLEKDPKDSDVLYNLMRISHTLKGMCATMGFENLAELCHAMEDFFDAARNGKLVVDEKIADALFESLDGISTGIEKVIKKEKEPDYSKMLSKLRSFFETKANKSEPKADKPKPKVEKSEPTVELETIKDIKVSVERLDTLMNLMEELIVLKLHLNEVEKKQSYQDLKNGLDKLDRLTDEMQFHVSQARTMEVGYLFNRFPRMVRDLSKNEGKEVELMIEGADLELDRTIIDELGEPLVHLLRNAVDHGIEKKGTVTLTDKREKNFAIIEVADDGQGIDPKKVKAAALDKGIINEDKAARMDDVALVQLIFHPKLSTRKKVTDISGRGVGMAAVKSKVQEMNGTVDVRSKIGEGSTFTLKLPLTLAIIQALLVKVGSEIFALPITYIERNVNFGKDSVKKAADSLVAILDEDNVPLIDLRDLFSLDKSERGEEYLTVVVSYGDKRIGLVVDDTLSEEEIIVKPLTSILKKEKEFAGVTVLGDGRLVLILDIPNLV